MCLTNINHLMRTPGALFSGYLSLAYNFSSLRAIDNSSPCRGIRSQSVHACFYACVCVCTTLCVSTEYVTISLLPFGPLLHVPPLVRLIWLYCSPCFCHPLSSGQGRHTFRSFVYLFVSHHSVIGRYSAKLASHWSTCGAVEPNL